MMFNWLTFDFQLLICLGCRKVLIFRNFECMLVVVVITIIDITLQFNSNFYFTLFSFICNFLVFNSIHLDNYFMTIMQRYSCREPRFFRGCQYVNYTIPFGYCISSIFLKNLFVRFCPPQSFVSL